MVKKRAIPRAVTYRKTDEKPRFLGWATTDEDEIKRRRERARTQKLICRKTAEPQPLFGEYDVTGDSAKTYRVELRSFDQLINSCTCRDYQVNGLGTCKHVEAVTRRLAARGRAQERRNGSPRIEIYLDRSAQRVRWHLPAGLKTTDRVFRILNPYFDSEGNLRGDPTQSMAALRDSLAKQRSEHQQKVRLSQHLDDWLERLLRRARGLAMRDALERDLQAGRRTVQATKCPLYPYQQEGMLHLACKGRALLADEMGLGKTVQAVAASTLLKELHGIRRVLVISPASLKGEWLEQIEKFSDYPATIVSGPKKQRQAAYTADSFFILANYEQIRYDLTFINERVRPDLIVLDEAQRIKNWQTKTAAAIKSLASPYAFVLTGTPLENRIDEIYSIVEFLDPWLFGPLFQFNRDFYQLDENGRPVGYKNLDELHRRLQPIMLRRRKHDVEGELPARTDKHYFVPMAAQQMEQYEEHAASVARLMSIAKRRPLKKEEMDKLQMHLACMRMSCDTPFILDQETRISPKLDELKRVITDLVQKPECKIIVFSEWERMLQLVGELLTKLGLDFALHTGRVSQKRRRLEINRFRDDASCQFFLATDSAATGLNLQAANVVVNLDLPWNPAKVEQRIARAWRKHQTRSVSVLYFVSEHTIEHRMLDILRMKSELADEVVDGAGRAVVMKLPTGRRAFIERLETLVGAEAITHRVATREGNGSDLLRQLSPDQRTHVGDLRAVNGRLVARTSETNTGLVPALTRLAEKTLEGSKKTPLALSPEICAAIRALVVDGVLQVADSQLAALIEAPPANEIETDAARVLRTKIEQKLGVSRRRASAAVCLKTGGFVEEALTPMTDALENALSAGALKLDHACETPIPITDVHAVAEQYQLGGECVVLITRLRHEMSSLDEDAVATVLDEARVMTERLDSRLRE